MFSFRLFKKQLFDAVATSHSTRERRTKMIGRELLKLGELTGATRRQGGNN
jgi:hypothetical protein